jgi:high-affinity nickel permease
VTNVSGLLPIVAVGFVLGMRHACDADHVVAISTIVARHRSISGAALVGAVWGIGHTVTIMIVGAAIIAFSVVIPPRMGLSLEMSVGVMLIVLGVMNLTGVTHRLFHRFTSVEAGGADHSRGLLHSHPHSHGERRHSHSHLHLFARGHETVGTLGLLRALTVGIVHGLAGSAAIALLVLSTIHDPLWSVIYLAVFGLGTIAGMMLISMSIAVPLAITALQSAKLERSLVLGSGLLSLGFGIFIVLRIGFWDRLF